MKGMAARILDPQADGDEREFDHTLRPGSLDEMMGQAKVKEQLRIGIEAARQAIIQEVVKVIDNQGLNIDIRHIMLIADTMCANGSVKGITRYGIVSEKSSVLARASFETPIKHVVEAALLGEEDKLNSVVENIMINQVIPVGTGVPSLILKKGE